MIKRENENKKNDWFTKIMIIQTVVCVAAIIVLFAAVRTNGELGEKIYNDYKSLMSKDYTADDVSEAFDSLKGYSAVFSSKQSDDSQPVFSENLSQEDNSSESESLSGIIGGGDDLKFSGLDTLEGICFDEYKLNFDIALPVNDYTITSGFGYRIGPITGEPGIHTGLDMAADYGTSIYAAADGIVADAAYDNSYGNYVKLRHDDNTVTIYAHCSRLCVEEGEKVKQGDKIAEVGSTGSSTGNHLHFEMRKDNIRINPEFALFK